ncbi:unnamed protein product [Peronospora belbahrii]|uniref:Uncharacterized protein n=1 Tax=Peronospora belbahrii TaxID=622444 RepID=A0ABN8D699_9STRA|nr:unnamed protein product [Peronospora belbahrii]
MIVDTTDSETAVIDAVSCATVSKAVIGVAVEIKISLRTVCLNQKGKKERDTSDKVGRGRRLKDQGFYNTYCVVHPTEETEFIVLVRCKYIRRALQMILYRKATFARRL